MLYVYKAHTIWTQSAASKARAKSLGRRGVGIGRAERSMTARVEVPFNVSAMRARAVSRYGVKIISCGYKVFVQIRRNFKR